MTLGVDCITGHRYLISPVTVLVNWRALPTESCQAYHIPDTGILQLFTLS